MKKQILAGAMFALAASVFAVPSAYAADDCNPCAKFGNLGKKELKTWSTNANGDIIEDSDDGQENPIEKNLNQTKDGKAYNVYFGSVGTDQTGKVQVSTANGDTLFDGDKGTDELHNIVKSVMAGGQGEDNKKALTAALDKYGLKANEAGVITKADGSAVDSAAVNKILGEKLSAAGAKLNVAQQDKTVEDNFKEDRQGIAKNSSDIAETRQNLGAFIDAQDGVNQAVAEINDEQDTRLDGLDTKTDATNDKVAKNTSDIGNTDKLKSRTGQTNLVDGIINNANDIEQNSRDIGINSERLGALDKHTDVGKNTDGSKKTVREAIDEGDAAALESAKGYADGRIGDLGNTADLYQVDSATGKFVKDKDGNKVKRGTPKPQARSLALADDAPESGDATVEDWVGQGKAAYADVNDRINDLNGRFDTGMTQGKNYVDQTAKLTLQQANGYTDQRYNQLNGKLKKLRARADAGVAGATAIASLPFDSAAANSIGGGLGVAKNKVAGAVGFQHRFNAKWTGRGTVSVSDNYVQGGVGAAYSW